MPPRKSGRSRELGQIGLMFRSAQEPIPANFPRDLRSTVAAGWLAADADDSKSLYVTDTGQKAIEARFPAEMRKASRSNPPARRRRNGGQQADS